MEFYNDAAQFPNIKVVSGGLETIHKSLKERTSRPGTLALRDYFPLWKQEGMGRDAQKLTGGKLLVLGSCRASSDHHMFFDDNIDARSMRIVDVRVASVPTKLLSFEYLCTCHIVRAEPLDAVMDRRYFIGHVERMVAAYERRLEVRSRIRRLMLKAVKNMETFQKPGVFPQRLKSLDLLEVYDPWLENKKRRSFSKSAHFEELEPQDVKGFSAEVPSPKAAPPS